jgi:methylmalonyl-CoA mutase N-terminal domain/subunit
MKREGLFNEKAIEEIEKARALWQGECLRPEDLESEQLLKSASGIPLRLIYTPEDVRDMDYLRELGFPGLPPYTRGVYPNMYRGRPFTIRQIAGSDPRKTVTRG